MASVCIPSDDYKKVYCDIDYSIIDGRVRVFELNGKVLYDEYCKKSIKGWKKKLVKVVKEQGLNDSRHSHSGCLPTFVIRMIAEGLVKEVKNG